MPETLATHCPSCGEPIELVVDDSAGSHACIEDCPVCCRPMRVHVDVDCDRVSVQVRSCDE